MLAPSADHTIARRPLLDGPLDLLLVTVVTALVLGWVGCYATGQLAGLVTHVAWPPVSLGQTPAVLGALPEHLDDPRDAWPLNARSDLPGPTVFAGIAGLVIAVFGMLVVAGVRFVSARRPVRGMASRAQLESALSHAAVLRRARVIRPSLRDEHVVLADVGVDLGQAVGCGVRLACSAESSVLLLAAPRQGKTSQVVIPWLHTWPGPALVTSVRTDVLENTALLRGEGDRPVWVMAPTGMLDWPRRARWSPTFGCANFDRARRRADVMIRVGKSETSADSTGAGFFGLTATSLLAGWLHAAEIAGLGMDEVLAWALDDRLDEPVRILREHPDAAPGVAGMLDGLYRQPHDTRANLFSTVQTGITPLLSPRARDTFVPPAGRGLDLDAILRARGTVYLLVSEQQAADLAPLISAFVDELVDAAKSIADHNPGGRLDPPLGLFLDEVANVSPLPHLPALMSYAGGSGIFVTAVLQNLAQAEDRWGSKGAAMMWGASTVKIALGGLAGDEVRQLAELSGEYREALTNYQSNYQYGGSGHSLHTTLTDRKTLTPERIRTLSEARREALVLHATTPPVLARMTRHYEGPYRDAHARAVAHARALMDQARPEEAA
jgi:type IV secretory pathway TraG/TraD family ATPase VirD4